MKVLITGGSGFIGQNAARAFLDRGHKVAIIDRVRPSDERLVEFWGSPCDVGEYMQLFDRLWPHRDADVILHLAGQTAVTRSLADPGEDFESNVIGTFNVLEFTRLQTQPLLRPPLVIFTSTNKVYGQLYEAVSSGPFSGLRNYPRQEYQDGINEFRRVHPATPYGVSKYCAELYCQEYSLSYGIPTVILRQSCVYGPDQAGSFDQGWIANIIRAAVQGKKVTICGDGKQVRDCLFIEDLCALFLTLADNAENYARENIPEAGRVFNVGGGRTNTISILELLRWLASRGYTPELTFVPPRPHDQRWYVSSCEHVSWLTSWRPTTPLSRGLELVLEDAVKTAPASKSVTASASAPAP